MISQYFIGSMVTDLSHDHAARVFETHQRRSRTCCGFCFQLNHVIPTRAIIKGVTALPLSGTMSAGRFGPTPKMLFFLVFAGCQYFHANRGGESLSQSYW